MTGFVNLTVAYLRLRDELGPPEIPTTAALLLAGSINLVTSILIMRTHRSHIRSQTTTARWVAVDKKIEEGTGVKENDEW